MKFYTSKKAFFLIEEKKKKKKHVLNLRQRYKFISLEMLIYYQVVIVLIPSLPVYRYQHIIVMTLNFSLCSQDF